MWEIFMWAQNNAWTHIGIFVSELMKLRPENLCLNKDKWASSMEIKEDPLKVEVRWQQCTWAPQLELEGAATPWDTSVWEFQ